MTFFSILFKPTWFRRVFFILISFIFAIQLNAQNGYSIEVKVNGINVNRAFLGQHFGEARLIVDSATVKNRTFKFISEKSLPQGMYNIVFPAKNKTIEIILDEDQHFQVNYSTLQMGMSVQISGSESNLLYHNHLQNIKSEQQKFILGSINKVDLQGNINTKKAEFAEQNPDHLYSEMILAAQEPELPDSLTKKESFTYYKQHYFDQFDFESSRLLHTPLYAQKIVGYLDLLTYPQPDSIAQSIDFLVEQLKNSDLHQKWLLSFLMKKYSQSSFVGMDDVFVYLADTYYLAGKAPWLNEESIQGIKARANQLRPTNLGNSAPELNGTTVTGKPFNLTSTAGNYVVLYFWGYDCDTCKKTTPEIVALAKKYSELPVTFVTVNRNELTEEWKKAVSEYGLNIPNVVNIDAKNVEEVTASYNIEVVPRVFILDKEGKILSKKIMPKQVPEILNTILEKE